MVSPRNRLMNFKKYRIDSLYKSMSNFASERKLTKKETDVGYADQPTYNDCLKNSATCLTQKDKPVTPTPKKDL